MNAIGNATPASLDVLPRRPVNYDLAHNFCTSPRRPAGAGADRRRHWRPVRRLGRDGRPLTFRAVDAGRPAIPRKAADWCRGPAPHGTSPRPVGTYSRVRIGVNTAPVLCLRTRRPELAVVCWHGGAAYAKPIRRRMPRTAHFFASGRACGRMHCRRGAAPCTLTAAIRLDNREPMVR